MRAEFVRQIAPQKLRQIFLKLQVSNDYADLSAGSLLVGSLIAQAQSVLPTERLVRKFEVGGASRLGALAKLGSLTNTSLLIEVDSLAALQTPIVLTVESTTVADVLHSLLPPGYVFHNQDSLLIVSPRAGANNRVLTLPLGALSLHPDGISGLEPYLAFLIERATGCNPKGYGWAGPSMTLAIPQMTLAHATFEKIVTRVADAPEASMWIVTRETSTKGCIHDPASRWQIGLYGFGRLSGGCQIPFRESVGPTFIGNPSIKRFFPDDCKDTTNQ